jgi:hypothetical protein
MMRINDRINARTSRNRTKPVPPANDMLELEPGSITDEAKHLHTANHFA